MPLNATVYYGKILLVLYVLQVDVGHEMVPSVEGLTKSEGDALVTRKVWVFSSVLCSSRLTVLVFSLETTLGSVLIGQAVFNGDGLAVIQSDNQILPFLQKKSLPVTVKVFCHTSWS